MSRKFYNFEKTAYGRLDITYYVNEAIVPVVYRHGQVARSSKKLRRVIFDAAHDAVRSIHGWWIADNTNVFIGWSGIVVSTAIPHGYTYDEDDDWEVKLPGVITLKDCLRGYKRPRRSNNKIYTLVYNAVRAALQ